MRSALVVIARWCAVCAFAAAATACGGSGRDATNATLDVVDRVSSDTVSQFIYFANLENPQDGFERAFCDGVVSRQQLSALADRLKAVPSQDRPSLFLRASVEGDVYRYTGTVAGEPAAVWLTLSAGPDFPCITDIEVEPASLAPLFDPTAS